MADNGRLTHGEETVVAGDSAYATQMLKANCRQARLLYLIHDKATRAGPLSEDYSVFKSVARKRPRGR
jgi:hypothetical protein